MAAASFSKSVSFDDKAYLCPDTSTGMHSARSQTVYSTTDDASARKFKKYDFPISMLNCTPGTFHFMSKQVENFDGDSICDDGYLQWEYQENCHGITEHEIPNLSTDDLEKHEFRWMKRNAFKVCEEVSGRIGGGGPVAPDGYLKTFVTPDCEDLFFWDKEYLRRDIDEKDKNIMIPGYHIYAKLDNFMAKNFRKGEQYLEFVKFSCDDDLCDFCSRSIFVGPPCSRIPEPVPDNSADGYKYLHVKDTPTTFHGKQREVNDFNPRTNLKNLFQENQISSKLVNEIDEFCAKFIVEENDVLKAVKELECSHLRKQLKKQQKMETIKKWHFRIANENIKGENIVQDSNESDSELDVSDAEIEENGGVTQAAVVTDDNESDEHDPEADDLDHNSEPTAELLFSTTHSERTAGNWRLSEYFGKYHYPSFM
eukprot:gene4486-5081_t